MLLRRLGMALDVGEPGRPLGRITPVATSATLGDGQETGGKLLEFAGRVFGEPFDFGSVVGEQRMSADEWLSEAEPAVDDFDYDSLPLLEPFPSPQPGESHLERLDAVARVFFRDAVPLEEGAVADVDYVSDRHRLGLRLMRHPLTRELLEAAASPRPVSELIRDVAPAWMQRRDSSAQRAVGEFLALLSHARSGERPLLQVVDPAVGP